MFSNTIIDTKNFSDRLEEEYKWDKEHREECGWNEQEIYMIAEGMLQASKVLDKMKLEAFQNKEEYKKVVYGNWINSDYYDAHKQPIYICSACNGQVADYYIKEHKYCLHCGARMEK